MVAASFPNLSFEDPPGTGPTVVSTVAEPYTLVSETALTIVFAGVETDVVLLDSDFDDITAVSADDLAVLISARVPGLSAANDGGFVRLISLLTGEDVTLEVRAGGANAVLGFPPGAVTGQTYAGGPPNGWAVTTDLYFVHETAEFADENGRPEEIFDVDGWLSVAVTNATQAALFDTLIIPATVESFTAWAPTGVLFSVPRQQAVFDGALYETFSPGWGAPIYFAFIPEVHLELGAEEQFESGWEQGAGALSGPTTFAGGTELAETFEGVAPQTHVITVGDAQVGEEYRVVVNGVVVPYVAQPGDTTIVIASELATAITNSLTIASGAHVLLTPLLVIIPDSPDRALSVQASGPGSNSLAVVLAAAHPLLVEEWVGQDLNPDFD